MVLGIDASNIRIGGGVTHLVEVLRAAAPSRHDFTEVHVWSGGATLRQIEDRDWLIKAESPAAGRGLRRVIWQHFVLGREARRVKCDVLFIPGGSYTGGFRPIVALSQNLLPFERQELRRYAWSWMTLRLLIIRLAQSRTFRQSAGLIFLTDYARDMVMTGMGQAAARTTIIPHGVDGRFFRPPREQKAIVQYSREHPFRILYVSIIDVYKHQWRVAEAVAQLRAAGLPVALDLIGPVYPSALARLQRTLMQVDPSGEFIRHVGPVPYADLHRSYADADLFVFASSCENLPNILLEAMAHGLPIACSNRGPMPEVLGDAGVYFDPEKPPDIARALQELILSAALRQRMASASFARAQAYSWPRCAAATFQFLAEVGQSGARG